MIFSQISNFKFQIFLALLFILPECALADSWNLVTSDFQPHPVKLVSIDAQGLKVADTDGSSPRTVPWSTVLELDHIQTRSGAPNDAPFSLRLNGGDSIGGAPVSVANDIVTWKQPLLGQLEIPEDRVSAIVRTGQAIDGLDSPRKADSVRLLNADLTTGVMQSLDANGVSIQAAGADNAAQISLDKVSAILLADPDPLASSGGANSAWRVWLSDGSSLTVPVATLSEKDNAQLAIGFSPQKTSSIDLSAISSIELLNGPVRWLTELTPTEVVYHPYLDENFPPQFDHPVDDPTIPIRSRFPSFRHGIGVHSYTKLTYAVPNGVTSFRTQFAIERIPGSDMSKADVTVRLLLDGKAAKEFPHIHYGGVAEPLTIDVSTAKEISLEVDYGDNLDAQDRFVWLDPAFVK